MITIDCREAKLLEELLAKQKENVLFKNIPPINSQNLLLGDITLEVSHHKILFERKTVDDLLASIKDGRYEEQSYRLQTMSDYKVYYIIEGRIKREHRTVFSSILSLNYFKGYSVLRTDDVKETANMILYFTLKLIKEKDKALPTVTTTTTVAEDRDYSTFIQKKKNDNITKDNFAQIVLCQIPLVSSVSASAIMNKYDNDLNTLIAAIKEDRNCLGSITYKTTTDKERKISKTCISNIVTFLDPPPKVS
jgi:ERCC4-type nuclease